MSIYNDTHGLFKLLYSPVGKTVGTIGVFLVAFGTSSVAANDGMGISLSANAAIVSDYRFRGVSLSDKDVALQGGMDLNHESGFYVGTWGSSIESFAGSEVELDIYAGYAREIGALTMDVGLLAYTYPGSSDTHYIEAYGSVGGTVGVTDWTIGAAYAWDQENLGSQDNIYVYFDAGVPLADTGFSLAGHIGYEDGAFGNGKWDWSAGVSYDFKQFSVGISYVDTNVDTSVADSGVVASLSASF